MPRPAAFAVGCQSGLARSLVNAGEPLITISPWANFHIPTAGRLLLSGEAARSCNSGQVNIGVLCWHLLLPPSIHPICWLPLDRLSTNRCSLAPPSQCGRESANAGGNQPAGATACRAIRRSPSLMGMVSGVQPGPVVPTKLLLPSNPLKKTATTLFSL